MAINNCTDAKSYTSLHTLVNDMFPPTSLVEQVGLILSLNLCKKYLVPFGVKKKGGKDTLLSNSLSCFTHDISEYIPPPVPAGININHFFGVLFFLFLSFLILMYCLCFCIILGVHGFLVLMRIYL